MVELKILENLKNYVGKKITVLKPNELVPTRIYGTLEGFYLDKFAQYDNCLYLYIKGFRQRHTTRIIIDPHTVAFIFVGDFQKSWNKEKINENLTNLLRITYEDVKDDKNLILNHAYAEEFQNLERYEYFSDITADYCYDNDIFKEAQLTNEGYKNYIKDLITLFNVENLKNWIHINIGCDSLLEKVIDKSMQYNW